MNSPSQYVPNRLLEESAEIAPKEKKMSQSRKKCPIVDMSGGESRV